MKRTEYFSITPGVLAAFVLAAAAHGPALAQSDTKTLSGKGGTGKIMTREELRACMKQQADLATRKADAESRQSALTAQRGEIQAEADAIKAEQEAFTSGKGQIEALNQRVEAFKAKAKQLNERRDDFERMGKSGPAADRERRLLEKEAGELKTEEAAINADRDRIVANTEAGASKLNARVEAQQQKAQAWNDLNKKLTKDQQTHEDDRIAWLDNCGNRRYKEDDEKAIKAGK